MKLSALIRVLFAVAEWAPRWEFQGVLGGATNGTTSGKKQQQKE